MRHANAQRYGYLLDYELWICGKPQVDGFHILGYVPRSPSQRFSSYQLLASFEFCVEDGSALRPSIQGKKIPRSPRSLSVLNEIEKWMRDTETKDQLTKPPSMPTRILEIEENGQCVILCNSANIYERYTALSHCWGIVQPITFNTQTGEELHKGIRTAKLPQSFQDAIWLTIRLGIRYLWIDSLCIIQDDVRDWARESARMHEVYGNAALTIAASRSAGNTEGFLGDRLEPRYISIPFSSGEISDEVLCFATPLKYAVDLTKQTSLEDAPLSSRGWALQERFMSQRTLHFTQSQVLVEYKGNVRAEDSGFTITLPKKAGLFLEAAADPTRIRHQWTYMVEQYSHRKLTIGNDKLPALAGIAALFSRQATTNESSTEYLGGLWSNDLLQHLCWNIDTRVVPGVRPTGYRAPTWSWACVDGVVSYHWGRRDNELAFIQRTHVGLKYPEIPFGEVIGGWIHLKGTKLPINRKENDDSFFNFAIGDVRLYAHAEWDAEPHVITEQYSRAADEAALVLLPLIWDDVPDESKFICGPFFLILKPVNLQVPPHMGIQTYQRIGSCVALGEGVDNKIMKGLIKSTWIDVTERRALEDIILI
ncbi:heterokaryon incompatibility protein-domain-containing protein [Truncatella angustata]|uniref:Heterokaryon incompatibility protein-domain-containing protein n=1 Tax=Truncatella angustata TaxID=152316 RepID=A0A9P8ULV9_9PEZI|nr:heterokaryon incompatibility protein-domain-containing protein [Truncatella angustata]KAH6654503.1 heterokaryon incompatibility protein-domain-containing protein [Truncatella angustata]